MQHRNELRKERSASSVYTNEGIGRRLKELRCSRGLTLAQLAAQTDLSISSLSQVERGLVSPTIRTVYALSVALDVSLAWIIDPDSVKTENSDEPYVVRSTQRKEIFNHNGVTKHLVTPEATERYVGFVVKVGPNGSSGDKQHTHAGEELAFILSGSLVLEIEGNAYRVNKGDAFAFPSTLPHRFYNETSTDAVVFWINSPK
jgi:transcriptional regulator with XRE-family HTH domain